MNTLLEGLMEPAVAIGIPGWQQACPTESDRLVSLAHQRG